METNEKLDALEFYIDRDMDLVPLKRWNTTAKKGEEHIQLGKAPRDKNWRKRRYGNTEIKDAVNNGYNIGWRLGPQDLVLDVDPKNGGDKSLKRIEQRFDVCFETIAPTIITGSGGRHFYFDKDPSIKTREVLDDENGDPYPGIEFKAIGRQVVIAGSRHPNGVFYDQEEFSPTSRTELPGDIFALIKRESRKDGNASSGKLSTEELGLALEQLDATDYSDHDDWLRVMMACHHATDGDGSEEFIQWSTSDPTYSNDHNMIRMRWDSLHGAKSDAVTYKTLYQEVKKAGGSIANIDAMSDFDIIDDDYEDDKLTDENEIKAQLNMVTQKGLALDLAMSLSDMSSDGDIKEALLATLSCKSEIEKQKAIAVVVKKTKMSKAAINAILKELRQRQLDDLGEYVAKELLRDKYANGKHLVRINDSEFWRYNGKHWEAMTNDSLRGQIIKVVEEVREKLGLPLQTVNATAQVEFILRGLVSAESDVFRRTSDPLPVLNCLNGELWIGEDGSYELTSHKYSSYLTSVLNVEYDPEATCPKWDKSIAEIFDNTKDTEGMVRHIEEFMGYVLQPYKDIASWWLFKGQGSNGKSLVCDILAELAGNAVLPCSLKDLDPNKNAHAMANLPGKLMVYDDDLDVTTTLPDGVLKKISERKRLEANPKNKPAFQFISVATPIMLANKWPLIRDVSNGTRRRAQVVPFTRIFTKAQMDKTLARTLKRDEMPGILNRCLVGLRRLRERGDFEAPRPCLHAADDWLRSGNSFAGFVEDCLEDTENDKDFVYLSELYAAYTQWTRDNGVTYTLQKSHFKENLTNFGIKQGPKRNNKLNFRKIKLVNYDDDFLDL